ncbi:hypothetical protein [Sanguibacter sp. HDW7]|uniref:hypothetical protein n=1 Tax=Sanguibacter sp. HDW7 TaxID=2714931 RepID=UPI00197EF332|nr:hypothetical protein [Sanguibacter sp. HDW7]
MALRFNPAPGWPPAPEGWTPPPGWQPDPSWPPAPQGWALWVDDAAPAGYGAPAAASAPAAPSAPSAPDGFAPPPPAGAQAAPDGFAPAPPAAAPATPAFGAPAVQPPAGAGAPPSFGQATYASPGGSAPAPLGSPSLGTPGAGQPGLVVPGSSKSGMGVWIAFVVVLLLAVGGYFVWQGLSKDDDKTPSTAPTAQPTTPSVAPTDAPAPTDTPTVPEPTDLPTDVATDEPTDTPTLPGLPGDLGDCMAFSEAIGGWSIALFEPDVKGYLAKVDVALPKLEATAPPAGLEDEWATYVAGVRTITEHMRSADPSASPITVMTEFLVGDGRSMAEDFNEAGEAVTTAIEKSCM